MKTALFIDGSNLYASAKSLQMEIDYKKLLSHYRQTCDLRRAYYYTAMLADDNGEENLRPLTDWLAYNGYHVVQKKTKTFVDKLTGATKIKGNMDIEIAVDMVSSARYLDNIVLFSGDGDFTYAVRAVQSLGVSVTVVSTLGVEGKTPPMIADELRRACDVYKDINDFRALYGRTKGG